MAAISANIVLVCDLMVKQGLMQSHATFAHPALRLLCALSQKQVIDFFVDVRLQKGVESFHVGENDVIFGLHSIFRHHP